MRKSHDVDAINFNSRACGDSSALGKVARGNHRAPLGYIAGKAEGVHGDKLSKLGSEEGATKILCHSSFPQAQVGGELWYIDT